MMQQSGKGRQLTKLANTADAKLCRAWYRSNWSAAQGVVDKATNSAFVIQLRTLCGPVCLCKRETKRGFLCCQLATVVMVQRVTISWITSKVFQVTAS